MDTNTFDQFDLSAEEIEEIRPFLIEDMEGITALITGEKVLTLRMPPTIDMKITECPPSMKGASVTSRYKPATLTTGLVVQVPEYIAPGDVIRVNTEDRTYLGRA